ncbi:predicted protein [Clavispora lusitaniae ATCC 42720]|uniref:Uncharacterized protein n=1 Tax=Clavispora lusitaniae (strain ATCC 42720) TaxID=306902 RepID=C4YAA6_CLAL4|nr:uncharacterized protein CLUG_05044 [Clavispora lusitaniae ATCC 42720]EEQ40917.1 predicted protein [Clavispora lusitaniae ATCC 42720]
MRARHARNARNAARSRNTARSRNSRNAARNAARNRPSRPRNMRPAVHGPQLGRPRLVVAVERVGRAFAGPRRLEERIGKVSRWRSGAKRIAKVPLGQSQMHRLGPKAVSGHVSRDGSVPQFGFACPRAVRVVPVLWVCVPFFGVSVFRLVAFSAVARLSVPRILGFSRTISRFPRISVRSLPVLVFFSLPVLVFFSFLLALVPPRLDPDRVSRGLLVHFRPPLSKAVFARAVGTRLHRRHAAHRYGIVH